MAFTQKELIVVDLFVAAYGRAPTKAGLDAFVAKMDNEGWTDRDIAKYMFDTANNPEAATRYPDSASLEDKVNAIFNHVLGRPVATQQGMDFWKNKLADPNYTLADVVLEVIKSAKEHATDAKTLENKETVVEYFLNKVPADEQAGNQVKTDSITADQATVDSAKAAIDAIVPADFKLTTGQDDIATTANDDLIKADLLTLQDNDKVVDPSTTDNDTMMIETTTDISDATTITNIENLKITTLGAHSFDFTNITGVKTIENNDSTGTLTINNIGNIVKAVESGSTSKMVLNFTGNALAGTQDAMEIDLNSAQNADIETIAGFESLVVNVNGDSSVAGMTIPGVTTSVFKGSGALTIADNVLDSMHTNIFRTAEKLTLGNMNNVTLLDARDNTAGVVSKTTDTDGFATKTIALNSNGAVITGDGDDNLKITGNSDTNAINTIKLGDGNNKLVYNDNGGQLTLISGSGDDVLNLTAEPLENSDVIKAGDGTDTLMISGSSNAMTTESIENLTLISTTTVDTDNMDQAVNVDAKIDGANDITVTNLKGGSTFKTSQKIDGASNVADDITVSFKNAEANSTLDITTGYAGNLTITKISDATVNLGAASVGDATKTLTTDGVNTLTINAEKAYLTGKIADTTANIDALKSVTVNGKDAITMKDSNGNFTDSTVLETLNVTGAKAVDIGNVTSSDKLSSVAVSSTGSSATVGDIGSATVLGLSSVNVNAAKAVDVNTVKAKDLGTVTLSSTNANVEVDTIAATDADGYTVDITAATTIKGSSSATTVSNTGGNITAKLSGEAEAEVNFTTATSGHVTAVDASALKGGLTTTITNADSVSASANATTVSLGAKLSSTQNKVTMAGSTNTLTFNGSNGADTLDFASNATLKSGTLMGGAGDDTLDLTNLDGVDTAANGAVMNLGSTSVTVGDKTVTAGHIVEFDGANIVTTGYDLTANNFETLIGTDSNDYIIGAASVGNTIQGGKGADKIKGGAGADKFVYTAASESYVVTDDQSSNPANQNLDLSHFDTICNIDVAKDTLVLIDKGDEVGVDSEGKINATATDLSSAADLEAAFKALKDDGSTNGIIKWGVYDYNNDNIKDVLFVENLAQNSNDLTSDNIALVLVGVSDITGLQIDFA